MALHESAEMYLETIYLLSQQRQGVRSIDVAEHMGYSKPSISRAIGLLKQGGYVTVDADGFLQLTDSGLETAQKVFERHTVVSRFLISLGVEEATAVEDIIGDKYGYVAEQGKGGCVSFLDSSSIASKEMYDFVFRTAEKHNIPVQAKTYVSGGNDAGPIHLSGKGAKTVVISAPTRYIHTASNVIDERDLYSIIQLAKALLADLAQ